MAVLAATPVSVSVLSYSDPSETRPKDAQAIVFPISRDIPNETYIEELNKYVKNDDRMCFVLEKPEHAAYLVDNVRTIKINNNDVTLKYLVAKSVKIIISNAGYGVTFGSEEIFNKRLQNTYSF